MQEFKSLNGFEVKDAKAREDIENILEVQNGLKSNLSNPNLLINSDFRNPVNQRGKTSYEGSSTIKYTIDRWCISATNINLEVTVNNGSIKLTNKSSSVAQWFGTRLEVYDGDIFTISCNVLALTGSAKIYAVSDELNKTSYQKALSVGLNTVGVNFSKVNKVTVQIEKNSSVTLEWIKLEAGSIATPFAPRPYAEELAMCQRYYQKMCIRRIPMTYGANNLFFTVPLNNPLRDTPTISLSETWFSVVVDEAGDGVTVTPTSIVGNISNNVMNLNVGFDFGISNFRTGMIYSDTQMYLDAEIY